MIIRLCRYCFMCTLVILVKSEVHMPSTDVRTCACTYDQNRKRTECVSFLLFSWSILRISTFLRFYVLLGCPDGYPLRVFQRCTRWRWHEIFKARTWQLCPKRRAYRYLTVGTFDANTTKAEDWRTFDEALPAEKKGGQVWWIYILYQTQHSKSIAHREYQLHL